MKQQETIVRFIEERLREFDQIPEERKTILKKIAAYIRDRFKNGQKAELIYICIHNSRRSHFGQIAGAVAATYFQLDVQTYSGGTVATAFHPNAIAALQKTGFRIDMPDHTSNPHYKVWITADKVITCFSKLYDDPSNPQHDFAAIMTCSEAEENCPFIANAGFRVSTPYEDPKSSDGTGDEMTVYTNRFSQIMRETLYVFSLVNA